MKTINAVIAALTVGGLSAPALAHEPAQVTGGLSGMAVHFFSQPDHLAAMALAVALGAGWYLRRRKAVRAKTD